MTVAPRSQVPTSAPIAHRYAQSRGGPRPAVQPRARPVRLFEGYFLAAPVLAPAGAILIATSLAIRALDRLYSSPCARAQLIAGPTLLAEGRLQGFIGANILTAITDLLGAIPNAGTFIAGLLVLVPDTRRSTARTSCRARVGAHSHAARAGSGRPRAGRRAHR